MNRRYRKTIIAGNWKMNKTASETKKFAEELKALHAPGQVVRHRGLRPRREHRRRRQGASRTPRDVRGRAERVL